MCQVRLDGICNFDPDTTVFAHVGGAGMGTKQPDIEGTYACNCCHDVIDGRVAVDMDKDIIKLRALEGGVRTRKIMIDEGILKL
jgi:hypothetical protein